MNITKDLIAVNVTKGRKSAHPLDTIVIHVMEGTMAGTRSWFHNSAAEASAHYGISRAGVIVQYVEESDTAWHAGRVHEPVAPIVLERQPSNPNGYSIGIEHEGTGKSELTPEQHRASVWLIRDICTRRNIPITRRHIIGHREVFSRKTCPGRIDVDLLVAAAQTASLGVTEDADAPELVVTPPPVPQVLVVQSHPPRLVWSGTVNDYLVVTRYANDADWSYVKLSSLAKIGTKATTPLSRMLLAKP